MEIRKESWHAKFYLLHELYLPQSLCPYFWRLLLYIALLPIQGIPLLFKRLRDPEVFGARIVIGVALLSFLFMPLLGEGSYITEFITMMIALAAIVGLFCLIGSIIYGIYKVTEYVNESKIYSSKPTVVGEWWKGFKGKYCPKIDWK
jgi:hypothetical protein